MMRLAAIATLIALSGCNGFDTGLNPRRPDVQKETGPLTAPPPGVLKGTAL